MHSSQNAHSLVWNCAVKISRKFLACAPVAIAAFAALNIPAGSDHKEIPGDAIVFAADSRQIYYAPSCVGSWLSHPAQGDETLRGAPHAEMSDLGYSPEARCEKSGGFAARGRSFAGHILQKAGLLPAKKQWWERSYRAENGVFQAGVV
jgi:hypothetical protein